MNVQKTIHSTQSICPACHQKIPAQVVEARGSVLLQKTCPEHGDFSGLVCGNVQLYKTIRNLNSPNAPIEILPQTSVYHFGLYQQATRRTCLIILDITQQCNANCNICIADKGTFSQIPPLSLRQIERNLDCLYDELNTRPPVQLSGGEPTVHKDLIPIIKMIRKKGFSCLDMNTNGILLAQYPDLAIKLKDAGLTGIFLQFDGLSRSVYEAIRGRDLLDQKLQAIENCQKADLPIVIQPTIMKNINDNEIWRIIEFAAKGGMVGVDFLPYTPTGRIPAWNQNPVSRLTLAEIMMSIERQSGGKIRANDLIPIPCQDSRCAFISYMLIQAGELRPLTRIVDFSEVKENYGKLAEWETILTDLTNKNRIRPFPAKSSCCMISRYDLQSEGYFIVGAHSFQDAWNFDIERAKLCCFHELTANGKLIPFCYYSITRNQWVQPIQD